jgi:hypothetical protein
MDEEKLPPEPSNADTDLMVAQVEFRNHFLIVTILDMDSSVIFFEHNSP